ncbi:phosphotransferase-like protein [Cellulomonas fengjieae]|uniref:AAA family ATPase n=1 Tax=Cellulomonas fengjieae TaxID=2819978 RepID=A0ABS3SIN8_9CELL|nr:AAA family ATPase [Cellulomonas fengjieae]MBO3085605.1 AAA family ATPase [Cellulomonas fengjieae]QVI67675.1 AAA family ATPase [Cellulomonas fengjieae]
MQEPGHAIMLIGTSGAGKSSTATELQRALPEPFLALGLDTFFGTLPRRWSSEGERAGDGFSYLRDVDDEGHPRLRIGYGPVGARVLAGMRGAVASLLREGNNVIVDEMPIDPTVVPAWRTALSGYRVLWVHVGAPLDVLEEREAERYPETFRGLSRGHYDVCGPDRFDLVLDSSELGPQDRAHRIVAAWASRRATR